MQPPGLFHLLPCGLLNVDLDSRDFQAFQEEVDNWRYGGSFLDRLFMAYGRFYTPVHQV